MASSSPAPEAAANSKPANIGPDGERIVDMASLEVCDER